MKTEIFNDVYIWSSLKYQSVHWTHLSKKGKDIRGHNVEHWRGDLNEFFIAVYSNETVNYL